MSVLERILKDVRQDVRRREKARPIDDMDVKRFKKRSMIKAIKRTPKVPVIAEIKRASPSAGNLKPDADIVKTADAMIKGGAISLSVLTEQKHFLGDPNFLLTLRKNVGVPLLRKDFIISEYQVYEAADLGADAVLLIARVLDEELERYMRLAKELGMESLVEVFDAEEMELASSIGANFIGINNRNLDSLEVDLHQTGRLAPLVPDTATLVSESGIKSPADVRMVLDAGADAVLVGTAIMRAKDIEMAVKSLVEAS